MDDSGIFCKEEKIAKARCWVTESGLNLRTVSLGTSERPRRRDLSQPHNSGLENVGKVEATISESASQKWQ